MYTWITLNNLENVLILKKLYEIMVIICNDFHQRCDNTKSDNVY